MKKYFTITIDTEPDCDIKWKRSDPLSFNSITFGIKKIIQPLMDTLKVNPVYFISPEVIQNKKSVEVLREIHDSKRCEIGNHLHCETILPEREKISGNTSNKFPCYDYSDEIEFKKLFNYDKILNKIFKKKIVSFRAARFGADITTISSLRKLNYLVDSSVTPNINWSKYGGPDFSNFPSQPYFIDKDRYDKASMEIGLLEVPVTIGNKRFPFLPKDWYFYNWLRPTIMTSFEMKLLINSQLKKFSKNNMIVFNLMFHSMEIYPNATPYTRNWRESREISNKLRKIIIYMIGKGVHPKTLSDIYGEMAREYFDRGKIK